MAIIRNDRRAREAQAEAQKSADKAEELVSDYSWHPSLEEFNPGITTEQWLQMLDDPTVFDEDGLHAVECLHAFDGPTTLQQMSVRFRGTMGRYRRWLNTTAQRVGRHLGMVAPQQDQFGNDEWWPLLYQRRAIGKVGANVHELLLRDELADALTLRDAQQKQQKKAAEQAEAQERERQVRQRAQALHQASQSGPATRRAAAQPSLEQQRADARQARAEREARLSQITVDRNTEEVPESVMTGVPEPEPEPVMSKAQAAVAARIAAAQARMGGAGAGTTAGARAAVGSEPAAARAAAAAPAALVSPAASANQAMAAEQPVDQPQGAGAAYEAEAAAHAAEPVAAGAAAPGAGVVTAAGPFEPAYQQGDVAQDGAMAGGVSASAQAAVAQNAATNAAASSGTAAAATATAHAANAKAQPGTALPLASIRAFFDAIKAQESSKRDAAPSGHGRSASKQSPSRKGRATESEVIHMPLDYATRYSNRMWDVFDAISPQVNGLTAAQVARRMHCDSVEPLQRALNAEEVPSFQLVDEFCRQLGVSHAYLESADDQAPKVPVFASVRELQNDSSLNGTNLAAVLGDADPSQIVFVKESGREHRAVVLLRYDRLRCLLLDRLGVSVDDAEAAQDDVSDAKEGQVVQAFLHMVHDLQDFCMRSKAEITSVDVSSEVWRRLTQGRIWPGEVCR